MKFCWVTINVKDMEKSLRFYQEVIGLNINRRMKSNPDREIIFLGSSDTQTQVELIYDTKATDITIGKDISLGFVVDSIEQMSEILKKKNIPINSGPFQPNSSIRFMYILDPNGIKIQFVENIK